MGAPKQFEVTCASIRHGANREIALFGRLVELGEEEAKRFLELGAVKPADVAVDEAATEPPPPSPPPASQPATEPGTQSVPESDLSELKRPQLDELAKALGVEEPDNLPNRGAVIEAIKAKQLEAGSSQDGTPSSEGDDTPQS